MIEAEFQDKFVDYLRKRHCFVKPLVGNTLMAGMPDLWIANSNGWSGHVELKMWKKKHDPNCHDDFIALLDGPQRYTIATEFWARGIFCAMLALCKQDSSRAWLYFGSGVIHPAPLWTNIAEYFLIKTKE